MKWFKNLWSKFVSYWTQPLNVNFIHNPDMIVSQEGWQKPADLELEAKATKSIFVQDGLARGEVVMQTYDQYMSDPKHTKWEKASLFFRMAFHYDYPVSRKGMHNVLLGRAAVHGETTIYDEYRCILERAGYVQRLGPGYYKSIKDIPNDLSYREARRQAYGNKRA